MKKLLILVLVFGLASAVNADPVGLMFSVNGVAAPAEITLHPSEAVTLDIYLLAGNSMLGYDITYTVDPLAELITAAYLPTYPIGAPVKGPMTFPAVFDLPSGIVGQNPQMVEISGAQWVSAALQGPQVIMDGLVLHCLGVGDTTLAIEVTGTTIINGEELPWEVVKTMLVHQVIPEPMTLTLLGLGSLFLVRRKK